MNQNSVLDFMWSYFELDFTAMDAESLTDRMAPLSGEWCLEEHAGVGALTLAAASPPTGDRGDAAALKGPAEEPAGDRMAEEEAGSDDQGVAEEAEDDREPETGCVLRVAKQRFGDVVSTCSLMVGEGPVGVVYRLEDGANYLCFELDPGRSVASLVRVDDGRRKVLVETEWDLPRNEWLHLYIRHINPFHNLSISGQLVLTTEYRVPGGFLSPGRVGLKCGCPRGAYVARFGATEVAER